MGTLLQRLQRLLQGAGDGELVDRTRREVEAEGRPREGFFTIAITEVRRAPGIFSRDTAEPPRSRVAGLLPEPRINPVVQPPEGKDDAYLR